MWATGPAWTVEKKEGTAKVGDVSFTVVDLPGIYSLSPYSMEELVARRFIIGEKPDAIINIVDATNLERNLYLTMQLLELERPMVLALNFMDEVEKKGDQIDCGKLAAHLGVPAIPHFRRDGQNIDKLVEEAHRQMHTGLTLEPDDLYDDFTHAIHHRIGDIIHDRAYERGIPAHWAAIKLLEGGQRGGQGPGTGGRPPCGASTRSPRSTRPPASWGTGRRCWRTAATALWSGWSAPA